MKVTNWRKKLAATLAAGGMICPAAANAANLDVNLVANPGFENVDLGVTGDYSAPKILDWTGTGFAYSHNFGLTGVPDYADGADPPGAGTWYFTANNAPGSGTGDIREPDVFYQDLVVSAGASGAQIASGEAAFRLSAYMSSYLNDTDFGTVHLQFKNVAGTTLGTARIDDPDFGPSNVWSLTSSAGFIPVGTATIRASLFGTRTAGGPGGDGYIDLVDVQVTNAVNELLFAQVNTVTGQVSIRNQSGDPVVIDYYEITSASNGLNRPGWNSLQDQNLAGFPAGNGSGNGWEEGGGGGNGAVSESYLTGNSTVIHNNTPIGLGALKTVGGANDLVFSYGVVPAQTLNADFDSDGDVDGSDFLTWQRGLGVGTTKAQGNADGDSDVDAADLAIWRGEFGASAFGGPSKLVQGFVRYVTSGAGAVPEPGSVILVGLGVGSLWLIRRRDQRDQ